MSDIYPGHAYLFVGAYTDWQAALRPFIGQFDPTDVRTFDHAPGTAWKIAEVRHIIVWAALRPYAGSRKLALIDGAERLTADAADALLKTLEEPPESAVFFLFTRLPWAVSPTIRSRAVLVRDRASVLAPLPEPGEVKAVQKLLSLPATGRLNAAQALGAGEDKDGVEAQIVAWILVFRAVLIGRAALPGIDRARAHAALAKLLEALGTLRQTPVQTRLLIDSILLSW